MAELHDTYMGRKLIEHTLPEIAKQLERIANHLENANVEHIKLKERYRTLSELDPNPKSVNHMHLKILSKMNETHELLTK